MPKPITPTPIPIRTNCRRTGRSCRLADPHGFHVDREGNVWVSDTVAEGSKGQTVIKFSEDGKVLMTLGKPGVTGDANSTDAFDQPTDIYVAPNGDIFVSQGHGARPTDRILKFSKDGKYIKSWGKRGNGPGEFDTPHQLAMDSTGRLLVADRVNNRIQIFDQDGKFLEEWKQFGRPSGLYIDRNDNLYSADHQSGDSGGQINPGFKKGIRVGSAKDGTVVAFIPEIAPDANMPDGRLFGHHLWRLDQQDECASLGQSNHAIAHTGGLRLWLPAHCAPRKESMLRRILAKYAAYYNEGRTHVSLRKDA
jgi:6-bladed beta-propeller